MQPPTPCIERKEIDLMKKLIGLIPLYDDDKDSYWMLPGYMKVIERCGALPVMLPLTEDTEELEQCLGMCDGLLLTGGHDVDPAVYGEEAIPECGQCCHARDVMEAYLLKRAVEKDLRYLASAAVFSL